MMLTYLEVFSEIRLLEVPSDVNTIVLATPKTTAITKEYFTKKAETFARANKIRYDLKTIARNGYSQVDKSSLSGAILRDPGRRP